MRDRPARHRGAGADEDALAAAVEALAVMLDAGVAPESAWRYLGEEVEHPVLNRVAAAIRAGTAPGEALTMVAQRAREPAIRSLAASWLVADAAGAPLAPTLRGLASALRDRAETAQDVDAALSGPRATARLMAWLPVVGLVMAMALGIDVIGTLIGSPVGWALLVSGLGLLAAGRAWTRRLVAHAARSEPAVGIGHDLTAIALAGGMSVPLAQRLVADTLNRVGLEGKDDAEASALLRLAERAGCPAIELLASASRQAQRAARSEGRRAAAMLAVRLLLPLGSCVLPAFLALGVAPVIVAMVSSTLTGLS